MKYYDLSLGRFLGSVGGAQLVGALSQNIQEYIWVVLHNSHVNCLHHSSRFENDVQWKFLTVHLQFLVVDFSF